MHPPLSRVRALASAAITFGLAATAAAAPFEDRLVQSPTIATPERGSLAGTLARTAVAPGDLARGSFDLPLPIETPAARGPLLAAVVPRYAPEAGLTEWGQGWGLELAIRRFHLGGEVDYAVDEFTSPWGRLVAGDDGYYYPAGAAPMTRLARTLAGGWRVETGDGTTFHFELIDATVTPAGTYAWHLSRVENLSGDRTTLTWTRNASGRPFLGAVQWGGRGDGTAYKMTLVYETVATPWVSLAPGVRHVLDRRVRQVGVYVKQGATYVPRWSYALGYTASPTGPGFYLTTVQRTMSSSQREPIVRYDYDLGVEHRAGAAFAPIAALDGVIASYGTAAILPSQTAPIDLEQNGLLDLELAYDHTALRQRVDGFAVEALPRGPDVTPLCRPFPSGLNAPRFLARMHRTADEPQVVVTVPLWLGTLIMVCDRDGVALTTTAAIADWDLDATHRLADVDGDRRPDLVRIQSGEVDVLRNLATGPGEVEFAADDTTTALSPVVVPDAGWIMDHNGDGRADLVVRSGNDLWVWLGIGGHRFESTGTAYAFVLVDGQPLPGLGSYELSHGDFNGDGLADAVVSRNGAATLYTNRGARYVETPMAALVALPPDASYPRVADLTASGDDAVVIAAGGRARGLALTTAATGLLRSADDGRGTTLAFTYRRTAPAPGVERRHATLASLTVATSGHDPITYQYDYGSPVWHSVGRFLVGYQSATRQAPFLTETTSFANDDDVAGVPTGSVDTDSRTPGVVRYQRREYEATTAHQVRWLRPSLVEVGLRTADGSLRHAVTTRFTAYARAGCAVATETTGPSGTLTELGTLATIAQLPDALHCRLASTTLTGTHADPGLDFTYHLDTTYDDRGQVTAHTQRTPGGETLVLQHAQYGADHRLATLGAPGRGTTAFTYDGEGRLQRVVDPAGVIGEVTSYDPVTERIRAIRRGPADALASFGFGYDGRERLARTWDDVNGGSDADPLTTITYRDPTSLRPGRVDTTARADAGSARDKRVTLVAADGETLLEGRWLSDSAGYAMGNARVVDRALARTRIANVGRMSAGTLSNLTSDQLRAAGTPLDAALATGRGEPHEATVTQELGVTGTTRVERTLTAEGLVTRSVLPDGAVAEAVSDAAGKPVRATDALGTSHLYRHDALGRLVEVTTPDGLHRARFDGFGRLTQVDRDVVGAIHTSFHPVSGLVAATEVRTPAGAPVVTATTSRDALGRPIAIHQQAGAASRDLVFHHDGQRAGGAPVVPGQTGKLTQVVGDGWTRTTIYDRLGRLVDTTTEATGWRSVQVERAYHPGGQVASETHTVRDGAGAQVARWVETRTLDPAGRIRQVAVDGAPLYELSYDDEGAVRQIAIVATGDVVAIETDAATGKRTGHALTTHRGLDRVRWQHNPRGQIASETIHDRGVDTVRTYAYSPRDQLLATTAGGVTTRYTYAASGQPASVTDAAGTRTLRRAGPELVVGDVAYHWDDAARVDRKGPWTFAYGPSGHLERATRPGRAIDFRYDDAGRRLVKLVDGTPARLDAGDVIVTADHVYQVHTVAGVTFGVRDNGVFRSLLTDARGTVVVDAAGDRHVASPYGLRTSRPALGEVVDFARLGWDPDLDVVRMGVRDYDANLAQFLTPDPLYLADLDAVARSPLDANLVGYARGNPLSFVDPEGTEPTPITDQIVAGTGPIQIAVHYPAWRQPEADQAYQRVVDALRILESSPMGSDLLWNLWDEAGRDGNKRSVAIHVGPFGSNDAIPRNATQATFSIEKAVLGSGTDVRIDPGLVSVNNTFGGREFVSPLFMSIAHELLHALHNARGESMPDPPGGYRGRFTNQEEEQTIRGPYPQTENAIAAYYGLPPRVDHKGYHTRPGALPPGVIQVWPVWIPMMQ